MKKKFILFLGLLGAFLALNFGLNLNAQLMFKDNPSDNISAFRLGDDVILDQRPFNVITGASDVEELKENQSIKYILEEMPKDNWNETLVFYYDVGYEANSATNLNISCYIEFNGQSFKRLNVYIEIPLHNYKGLMYSVILTNGELEIVFRSQADLTEIVDEYDTDYYIYHKYFNSTPAFNNVGNKECYQNFDLSFLYGMKFNPYVNGKSKTKVISDYDNPITLDEIYNNIKVTDKSGKANLYFIEGDYAEEGLYDIGKYYACYYAINDFGNVTKLYLDIEIKDIRGPVINCDTIRTSYKKALTDDELKSYITVTDSSDIKSIEYDFEDYKAQSDQVGEVAISVTATDIYDNVSKKSFMVNVIDDNAPIVSMPKNILSYDDNPLTLAQIKEKISITDDYDGEITDFTINDLDDYENKAKGFSRYSFEVLATDKSGNTVTSSFYVSYCNSEFPEIILDDLIFVLPDNTNVFKKDIEDLLKNLGYLNSDDSISIQSEIKNIDSLAYNMVIQVNSDKQYNAEFLIVDDEIRVNKFEEIINNSFDYTPFIIGGIIGSILIASIAMGVVIYRKKH